MDGLINSNLFHCLRRKTHSHAVAGAGGAVARGGRKGRRLLQSPVAHRRRAGRRLLEVAVHRSARWGPRAPERRMQWRRGEGYSIVVAKSWHTGAELDLAFWLINYVLPAHEPMGQPEANSGS